MYLWRHILALFAGIPYVCPGNADSPIDLKAHLTNTAIIKDNAESSVFLLSELANRTILSSLNSNIRLTESDIDIIVDQTAEVVGETFRAALASPVHFQVCPDCYKPYLFLELLIGASKRV